MGGQFRRATTVTFLYAVFVIFWIFFSGQLLSRLGLEDTPIHGQEEWLLLLITAFLIFYLIISNESRARASENRFRALVESSSDWIWEVDTEAVYTYASPKVESLLGYKPEEVLGKTPFDLMEPREAARVRELFTPIAARRLPFAGLINTNLHRNGTPVVLETSGEPVFDPTGRWQGYRGIDRDITERKKMEDSLRQSALVFENTREGVIITDRHGRIMEVNPAFSRITGYQREEVLGRSPGILHSGRQDRAFYHQLWTKLLETGHWRGEIWNQRKDGENFPALLSISSVCNQQGAPDRFVGIYTDLARLRESESQLAYLAQHDPLTDLPNRLLLTSRLEQAVTWARQYRTRVGALFIDLDHFKHINDSLGHPAGDELLVAVARRIAARLRPDDTLARLGGDEFMLLLEPIAEPREAMVVAQDLLSVLAAPFYLAGGQRVYLGASIGISVFPGHGSTSSELLRNAEAAMYHAKNNGRNQFCFYTEKMNTNSLARLELEAALRQAITRRELLLVYQPKVDLRSGEMTGCEALIRWQLESGEMIAPDRFIPLAEKNGQIIALGEWVINHACRQIASWRKKGLRGIRVAINVSARQFRRGNLAVVIPDALERHGLSPKHLELELTESMLMEDPEEAVTLLSGLKKIGLTLALDDFGTGYSSFAYLSRFPFDTLKIDRSFTRDITTDPNAALIATSIIGLAHRLGLRVVAEGVETESQLAFLRRNGCDELQGFFFSPPISSDDLATLYREGKKLDRPEPAPPQGESLLIVDDDPLVLSAMQAVLEGNGYRVLTASSGLEALEIMARHDIQVIISDEQMPGMSGAELLAQVKVLHPQTVRLVLTGYSELETMARTVNRGAIFKFLTKPWNEGDLCREVRDAFEYYQAIVKPASLPHYSERI